MNRNQKIRSLFKRLIHEEAGSPLVETALTLPMIFIMLLAAVEFGRISYINIEVSNAARAAASYGGQNITTASDTTGIALVAANDASNLVNVMSTTSIVSGVCSDGTACTGTNLGAGPTCQNTDCSTSSIENTITVTTSATVQPLFRYPGYSNANFTLTGKAVQKVIKN